ncbi:hypothetical protein GSI_12100 [Ganoderma sinense ZZ0214-1]|uniref:Transporter n=1 Tax=Ganoderma sinense ZZ0214-1 TaxID=1077348 RepID=A0A2G8RXX3_9APHY|nr:hypothetical protein GSI_12100 [Ganoderma sinense ZZ0214-1]
MFRAQYPGLPIMIPTAFLPLSIFITTVAGATTFTNHTIDDQSASPSFRGQWSLGPQCTGCKAQPDPSKAFDSTWHDCTIHPGELPRNVTVQFTGTAFYVYGILANTIPYVTTNTNLTFFLDGQLAGTFQHNPTTSTDFEYNVPMYSNSNLPNGDHTVMFEVIGDSIPSFVLIDYFVYTTVEQDVVPPPSSSIPSTTPDPPQTPTSSSQSSSTSTTPSTLSTSSTLPTSSQLTSRSPLSSPTSTSGPSSLLSSPTSASSATASQPAGAGTTLGTGNPQNASRGNSSVSMGAIVGGTVGGIAALVLLAALLYFLHRRRSTLGGSLLTKEKPGKTNAGARSAEAIFPFPRGAPNPTIAVQSPFVALYSDTPTVMSSLTSATAVTNLTSTKKGSDMRRDMHVVDKSQLAPNRRRESLPDAPLSPSRAPSLSESGPSHYTNAVSIPPMVLHGQDPIPPVPAKPDDDKSYADDVNRLDYIRAPPTPSSLNRTFSSSQSSTSRTNMSTLRNQVIMLQEEVERLRAEQELQRLLAEAPPEYVA